MVLFRLTHARRAEAQHARSQHRAKREQQGREQAEEQVGPAEPQPRQHGRTSRRAARRRLKLRGQLLRRPQLRGDLFLRIPVRQLEREVLFVFFHHIGGIRHISPAQLMFEARHKFTFCHRSHPPTGF